MLVPGQNGIATFEFCNGSEIRIIHGNRSQSFRGNRYLEALIDFIPTSDEEEYLYQAIIPYMDEEDADIEDDARELNEFLNSFTIRQEAGY